MTPAGFHLRVIYIETIFGDVCFRSVKGIVISNSAVIIMPICSVPYELKFFCCDFEGGCDCREGDLRTEDIFLGTDDNFLQFVHPVVEEAFRVQGSYVGWQGSYRMLVSPTPNNGVRIWIDYDKFKIFCWSIAAINNYGSEAHTLNCALLIASNILAQPTDYHKGTVSNLRIGDLLPKTSPLVTDRSVNFDHFMDLPIYATGRGDEQYDSNPVSKFFAAVLSLLLGSISCALTGYGVNQSRKIGGRAV